MLVRSTCTVIAALLISSVSIAQEPLEVRGRLDAVTVYRGQALVTRVVEVPGPAGLREVVVTNLPDRVVPNSIHAESADGVEVRSVRYRTTPVGQDVREEVRQIDQQIRDVQDQVQANTRHTQLLSENKSYLDKLEQFSAPTANLELTRGVLNAETLKALTVFLFDQRQTLAGRELDLAIEQRQLQEQLALLQRQRQELTGGSARTEREAVVFVNLQGAGGVLRVRYLVNNATWSPSYNLRANGENQNLIVEYNAAVEQMSGEDWGDVRMTLSTATPSLVARAPALTALQITLRPGGPQAAQAPDDYHGARQQLAQQRQQLEHRRNMEAVGLDGKATDRAMNALADQLWMAELQASERIRRGDRAEAQPLSEEGISVTYDLAGRTSLPSRSDRQLIQIASLPMQAEFYKFAIPVLTHYVYDEASVVNTGQMVLLAGPVSSYMNGQFVGHGQLPTVAVGQQFTIGFGIDSSLRATRELIEKNETTQGGNRVVDFNYRLAIENFGDRPATVRVHDRIPTARESEVKTTLVTMTHEISKDPAYEKTERKQGILRWEAEVPARAVGPEALAVDYQLRLEYDRNLAVAEWRQ